MMEAFLASLLAFPPQCGGEPQRRYTIEYVQPGHCGGGSMACTVFRGGSCRIMVVPDAPYFDAHIKHEKAHCACPWWDDGH